MATVPKSAFCEGATASYKDDTPPQAAITAVSSYYDQENPDVYERTLVIMTALFALYLLISELVADERSAPIKGDFRQDSDGNGWSHVTGKGNKDRTVTVSNAMLNALKRYRHSLGLSSLPAPNRSGPLIVKQRGRGPSQAHVIFG